MKEDLIYVAGALSGNECEYISNLSRMSKLANKVKRMGMDAHSPGNDFIQGVIDGEFTYKEYLTNSMNMLSRCDAMIVTPLSEDSKGVAAERILAEHNNIPVFETLDELEIFQNRPKIMTIVGESGSGKTTLAEWIEDEYNIPMIQSHTDRPIRFIGENGHTFHSVEAYSNFNTEDKIVETCIEGNRYCCLKEDVKRSNTYVIDEHGVVRLNILYKNLYKIFNLRIKRDYNLRAALVDDIDRLNRDIDFWLPEYWYDQILYNNYNKDYFLELGGYVIENFFDIR